MITRTPRASTLLTTLLVFTAGWFAAPQAKQGANDGFILFTTDRDNPSEQGICSNCEEIYVMAPDGSNPVRLTRGGADVVVGGPAYNNGGADWSHSSKLIAFQSNRVGGTPQVYLMNPDGTEQQVLLSLEVQRAAGLDVQGTAFPSFSPTGTALCFHSQDSLQRVTALKRRDIYVVNLDGTGLTNLTSPFGPGLAGDNIRCDWSPKGNAILFHSTRDGNEEIYSINADGTGLMRLTDDPEPAPGEDACVIADVNAAWSPRGDRIAFGSDRTSIPGKCSDLPEIWVMNADGSNLVQLTDFSTSPNPLNVQVGKPTWSPKGDRIAFHRRVGDKVRGHLQIYTITVDQGHLSQITFGPVPVTPEFSGFPSWGKWSAQD